jgi:phosphatidylserine synthase
VLVGGAARLAIGSVYGTGQAIDLIGSLADSGLYLGSGIATASATMLALMLTMLSFTRSTDSEFGEDVYRRVYRVSVMATLSLVGAVTLLLILTIPVQEMEGVPPNFFEILYNVLFALVTVCCALVVATVVMIYTVIRTVVAKTTPLDDFEEAE